MKNIYSTQYRNLTVKDGKVSPYLNKINHLKIKRVVLLVCTIILSNMIIAQTTFIPVNVNNTHNNNKSIWAKTRVYRNVYDGSFAKEQRIPNGKYFGNDLFPKNWIMIKSKNLYGIIDATGKEIVKPQYRKIHHFGIFKPNWALVVKDELLGFIDTSGKEVVKPQYDFIYIFGEYQLNWALVQKGDLYGIIDNTGKEIIKPQYDDIYPFGQYKEGWALVEKDGLYGFIDINGVEMMKPQFEEEDDICIK